MKKLTMILAGAVALGAALSTPAMAKWTAQDSADRSAIENLLGRYMYALDTADADAYAATFAEDATMGAGDMAEHGREHIRQYVVDLRARWGLPNDGETHWGRTRHVFYNFRVEIDGDTAKGGTYWETFTPNQETGVWSILATGTSAETFSKIDGEWYIQTRAVSGNPRVEPAAE